MNTYLDILIGNLEKVSTYDKEFIVEKLKLISASGNSLKIYSYQPAPYLHILLKTYNTAPRITTDSESNMNTINTFSTLDNHLQAHATHLSPAKQNPLVNTSYIASDSKYVYPASQIPINTTLAKRNPLQFKHSFQIQKAKFYAGRETKFYKPSFPLIKKHSYQNGIRQSSRKTCFSPNISHKISRLNLCQFHISEYYSNSLIRILIKIIQIQ